jgi:hypothetical protein
MLERNKENSSEMTLNYSLSSLLLVSLLLRYNEFTDDRACGAYGLKTVHAACIPLESNGLKNTVCH